MGKKDTLTPLTSSTLLCYAILKETLMKLLSLLLLISTSFVFGCSSENPICSDNFCVAGEIFPRSEIGDREFSEVEVDDAVIFATLATVKPVPSVEKPIPAEPNTVLETPVNGITKTTVASIVSNTLAGDSRFEGTLVEITGTVDWISNDRGAISLETNNPDVIFYVRASGDTLDRAFKTNFTEGTSYTFQLYIQEQEADPLGGYDIWSYPVEDVIESTVNAIVSDTFTNGNRFEGKSVELTATIRSVGEDNDYISLQTNNDDVRFFVDPFGNFGDAFERTFIEGNSYSIQIYIVEQEVDNETTGKDIIWAYLVK